MLLHIQNYEDPRPNLRLLWNPYSQIKILRNFIFITKKYILLNFKVLHKLFYYFKN